MSGSAQPGASADPSMEDILASIRRILSEDEAQGQPAAAGQPAPAESADAAMPTPPPVGAQAEPARPAEPEVFALDPSMLVDEPPLPRGVAERQALPPIRHEIALEELARMEQREAEAPRAPPPRPEPLRYDPPRPEPSHPDPIRSVFAAPPRDSDSLVAPEAAAAAASAVSSLVRRLAAERATPVFRNGPTIEDLVRDEMRPMLKAWLDQHLPSMVERLVRVEIERVVTGSLR